MQDIVFVVAVFLLAVLASKTTIDPIVFRWVKWSVFAVTAVITLLILNVESVGQVSTKIANYLNGLGIGYPRGWEIKTKRFDDVIAGCYYLTLFATSIIFILSTTYDSKKIPEIRRQDSLKTWGIIIISALIIIWFFGSGTSLESRPFGSGLRMLFNNQIGILVIQYIVLNVFAYVMGMGIRALYSNKN